LLYRAGPEWILGFRKQGSALCIDPCIPREWRRFEITYRHGGTVYRITVGNPAPRGIKGSARPCSRPGQQKAAAIGKRASEPPGTGEREHLVGAVLEQRSTRVAEHLLDRVLRAQPILSQDLHRV
jgi:hypothetical protein